MPTTPTQSEPKTAPRPIRRWQRLVLPVVVSLALLAGFAVFSRPGFVRGGSGPATRHTGGISWTDPNCGSCHRVDAMFSHPVNVVPSMRVPEHLPLDGGRITCATCHYNEDAGIHEQARLSHDPMLRWAGAAAGDAAPASRSPAGSQAFCAQCHGGSLLQTAALAGMAPRTSRGISRAAQRKALHPTMPLKAHVYWPGRRPVTGATRIAGLDEHTSACLTCHDGSVASEVGLGPSDLLTVNTHSGGHPVDVPYPASLDSKGRTLDDLGLVSRGALDARIRLEDGKVTCLSCHSPYSALPGQLVMSNDRSALCMTCHRNR